MRSIFRRRPAPQRQSDWVRIAFANHQPEADMLVALLENEGVRAFARRPTGADVPDMGAGGRREILVLATDAVRARELVDPRPGDAIEGIRS